MFQRFQLCPSASASPKQNIFYISALVFNRYNHATILPQFHFVVVLVPPAGRWPVQLLVLSVDPSSIFPFLHRCERKTCFLVGLDYLRCTLNWILVDF
jgi:hypothetical protein